MSDYRKDASPLVRDFLTYHEVIKSHSQKTVDEYYLDLRTFFRFLKIQRGLVDESAPFDEIPVNDVDLPFVAAVTRAEVYDFLAFLSRDRVKNERANLPEYGLSAASRARKIATLRSFYKYLTVKSGLLEENPIEQLDSPKLRRTLPKYLSVEECRQLLSSVDGRYAVRDYCILMLFLNCGLRISELVGLDLGDVHADHLRILGKGGKERVTYLNEAAADAINEYLKVRLREAERKDVTTRALFLSSRGDRISRSTVHALVKKHLLEAGLDADGFSAHKLRHTAATMLLGKGVDLKTLQELLGHEHLGTTEIYTHIENTDLKIAADANPLAGFKPKNGATED
ncbi:MAG: tyrosine recombinase XerC [Oscillospiraceae bacterium]|nr:tyrosine recombinase XerC [Oscillospiraceae bacterium]